MVSVRLHEITIDCVEVAPVAAFWAGLLGVVRDHDADTGSVSVEIVRNRRLTSVRVNVSAQSLDDAWGWARDRRTVVVNSKVRQTHTGLQTITDDAIAPLMVDVDRPQAGR